MFRFHTSFKLQITKGFLWNWAKIGLKKRFPNCGISEVIVAVKKLFQLTFTCSKLKTETLEKGGTYAMLQIKCGNM